MSETYDHDDPLAEALDVFPLERVEESPTQLIVHGGEKESDTQTNTDIQHVRSELYSLIEKGSKAVKTALEVAIESQSPRAYEVAGNLMKNVGDLTDKLIALQRARRDLSPEPVEGDINIEKAVVFSGSTADLLKMIKNELTTNTQQK
jgi:hypothetical protein